MNFLFFGYYSHENIAICRKLFENNFSCAGLYGTESLNEINLDFMSIGFQNDSFFNKIFIIEDTTPKKQNIIDKIRGMFVQYAFSPDAVIIRGRTEDLWPIASLAVSGEITCPTVAIIDDLSDDLSLYDKTIIDCFDICLSMNNVKNKTFISIFNNYDPSNFINYRDLKIPIEAMTDSVLVLTNSDNFKELAGNDDLNKEFISFVDVKKTLDKDICIYANISRVIVDATEDPETKLVMSKMGKKTIPYEDFDIKKVNFPKDSYEFLEDYKKNMVYFSSLINKEIVQELKNLKDKRDFPVKGKVIEIKEM